METKYIPITPGGTACVWLAADTEKKAWENLLKNAAHMPYETIEDFKERGYTVDKWEGS